MCDREKDYQFKLYHLAGVIVRLHMFWDDSISISGPLISKCVGQGAVIAFGIGTWIRTWKGSGIAARISLCLEAADNILSAHMGL